MVGGPESIPVPRGRHAPPLEVRLSVQRRRLVEAAAAVFARTGYATASVEAISREAGMSKATFYEHFANKEEAIIGLFDEAAHEITRNMAAAVGDREQATSYEAWVARGLQGFVQTLADFPREAQTLLVQIIGAGPRALSRRDALLELFADALFHDNATMAPRFGAPVFASRDDAFGVIGGICEVASRQLRTGQPADVRDIGPTLKRLLFGVLSQSDAGGLGGR